MADRYTPDPAEQPRCARCAEPRILNHVPLYSPDGGARPVWLCGLCLMDLSMTTPWPGIITTGHYARTMQNRQRRRGPKRRSESAPQFAALYKATREMVYSRTGKPPDPETLAEPLKPIMDWTYWDGKSDRAHPHWC